jgi:hypothetical protein
MSEATSSVVVNKCFGVAVAEDIRLIMVLILPWGHNQQPASIASMFPSGLSERFCSCCDSFYINQRSTLVPVLAMHVKPTKDAVYAH